MNRMKIIILVICSAAVLFGMLYILKPSSKSIQANTTDEDVTELENTSIKAYDKIEKDEFETAIVDEKPTQTVQPRPPVESSNFEKGATVKTDDEIPASALDKEVELRNVLYNKMEEYPNLIIDQVKCEKKECHLKYTSYDQKSREVTNSLLREYIDIYGDKVRLKNSLEKNGANTIEIVILN